MFMLLRKLMVIIYSLVLILALAFFYLLDFDLDSSPGWQVGLHYLLLLSLLLGPFLLVVQGRLPHLGWFDWGMLGLVALILAGVLALGWYRSGPYTDFRDARVLPLTLIFVGVSSITVCLASLFRLFLVVAWVSTRSEGELPESDRGGAARRE